MADTDGTMRPHLHNQECYGRFVCLSVCIKHITCEPSALPSSSESDRVTQTALFARPHHSKHMQKACWLITFVSCVFAKRDKIYNIFDNLLHIQFTTIAVPIYNHWRVVNLFCRAWRKWLVFCLCASVVAAVSLVDITHSVRRWAQLAIKLNANYLSMDFLIQTKKLWFIRVFFPFFLLISSFCWRILQTMHCLYSTTNSGHIFLSFDPIEWSESEYSVEKGD